MFKILGCIMIFIGSTCIGMLKASSYKERRIELENTIELLRILQMEIMYKKDSLHKSFMKTSLLKDCWFSQLLQDCCEELSTNQTIEKAWQKSICNGITNCPLYHNDLVIIKDLSLGIGKSDIKGQQQVFEPALIRLEAACNEAKDQERHQGKMYRSLGISTGIIIAILFI